MQEPFHIICNYIDETGIQLDDVWEMPYDKQQEHFTDYLIWLQAGLHSGDSYKKKPYNETCNAYLKEVFRFYRFSGQRDESTKQLKVLSDMRIIVHNSVGVKEHYIGIHFMDIYRKKDI